MDAKLVSHLVLRNMNKMRLGGVMCDVTLIADNKNIPVHKLVLAAASDLFQTLISENPASLVINGATASELLAIVDFLYTGQIMLTKQNVNAYMDIAAMLKLDILTVVCDNFQKWGKNKSRKLLKTANSVGVTPKLGEPSVKPKKLAPKVNYTQGFKHPTTQQSYLTENLNSTKLPKIVALPKLHEISVGMSAEHGVQRDTVISNPTIKSDNISFAEDNKTDPSKQNETKCCAELQSKVISKNPTTSSPTAEYAPMGELHIRKKADHPKIPRKAEDFTEADSSHTCPHCDRQYVWVQAMKRHIRDVHPEKAWRCPHCQKTFTTEWFYKGHVDRCVIGKKVEGHYHCPECEHFSHSNLHNMMEHYRIEHKKSINTTCQKCSTTFRTRNHFAEHRLQVHKEDVTKQGFRIHKCLECEFQTVMMHAFNRHKETHQGKFTCDTCKAQFLHSSYLRWHKQRKHGPKKYSCTECSFKTTNISSLNVHQYSKHCLVTTKRKAIYRCKECDYTSVTQGILRQHFYYKHSDIFPYKCSNCSKAYKRSFLLRLHEKKHTQTKSYKCKLCSFASFYPSSLKSHLSYRHTKEMAFMCENCGQRMKTSSALKYHRKACDKKVSRMIASIPPQTQPQPHAVEVVQAFDLFMSDIVVEIEPMDSTDTNIV